MRSPKVAFNFMEDNQDAIIKWFFINYVEKESDIIHILTSACINHTCSLYPLHAACFCLSSKRKRPTSLRYDIKYLVKLSDNGILGIKAGEMLNSYFEVNKILNQYPHESH